MDPQAGASFIPKKPLDAPVRGSGVGLGLFFLLTILIFIGSIIAAGASYGYQVFLKNQIQDKSHQLDIAQGAYDINVIEELMRLDTRMTQAKSLLAKHAAPSTIFAFLSEQTLQKVSFNSFTYTAQADGSASMTLSGQADSFSTVALQSDQFGTNKSLRDVIFSGITVNDKGGITFGVSSVVAPSLFLYSTALGTTPASVPLESTTASTTPTP